MNARLLIFDFDGTLADSFPFFVSVFNQLAIRHGFSCIDPERVSGLRHLGARKMMAHVGMPAWKLPLVARDFMALMRSGADGIRLFDGIAAVLGELAAHGHTLAIVSSNAQDNVQHILGPATTALFGHIDCGMSMFGKASRLRKLLRKSGSAAHDAIYIGDQLSDLEAARRVGMPFGAVGWGYATLESLQQHAPEHLFEDVPSLRRIASVL